MADVTRTNGVSFVTVGTPVQFIGKTQKFIAVVAKNGSGTAQDLAAEGGAGEAVEVILKAVAAQASIHAVQVENTTGQISIMIDGESTTAADVQAAVRALGTANSIDVTGSTATDVGFKLALS